MSYRSLDTHLKEKRERTFSLSLIIMKRQLDLSVLGDDNQFTQTFASLEHCLSSYAPITNPQCQEVILTHPLCKAI